MGGSGEQWIIVRNPRGQFMLDQLAGRVNLPRPNRQANANLQSKPFKKI
jgi:hypothetical protein